MPLDISSDAILEKNKIFSDESWLLLLKAEYEGESPLYICLNNETVTWPSTGGNVYLPAIFVLSGFNESKEAQIPSMNLSIIDIQRNLIPFIEEQDGGIGALITMYIVHSAHLDNTVPEIQEEMEVLDVAVGDDYKITFKLGAENLSNFRCPQHRYLKNHCRFIFKGSRCGYSGVETDCDRTFVRCEELDNIERFGGFPGAGSMGILV